MENSTPFDLNQALGQWRASLQNLGRFQAEELEELEGHLRESIALLHARGLSIPEAFAIATRRLGSERQLSAEFAKANPQRLWTERAMWMVAGVLVAYTLAVVARPLSDVITNRALRSGLDGQWAMVLAFLAGCVVWAGAAVCAYWILGRRSSGRDLVVHACIGHPVMTGLGLFIGLKYLQNLMSGASLFAEQGYFFFGWHDAVIDPQTIAVVTSWSKWEGLLTQLLWVAAGPLLAGYAWRKRGRPMNELSVSHGLQPGACDAARVLQAQGLSLDEAAFLLEQRRSPQEVVAPALVLATDRGMWLKRAAWMVAGVALNQFVQTSAVVLGWVLAFATRPVAPLAQHLAGLGSACLGLALGGTIVAGLWTWVTRHPSQSASIGRLCCVRPLVAALALVMVCVSISLSEYALVMCLAPFNVQPANSSIGPIVGQYFTYSAALSHLIIPIALLLWLARRWRSIPADLAPCH